MNRNTNKLVRCAQAQGVKLIRPLGTGGFALLRDGRWFEFQTKHALARWLKNWPGLGGGNA